ncbi:hypothetical protein DW061_05345 [Ruminococcus sp. AF42-9BH]|nr:hypothetical protein DW061_05345 [Ruminococcus sp. AF42-9BH]
MLNYEMFVEKLRKAIQDVSGWEAENVSFVPLEKNKFGEDRLEIVCIESATHVGCESLSTTELYRVYLSGKEIQIIAEELVADIRKDGRKHLFHAMLQICNYDEARPRLFIAPENINNKKALEQSIYKTVGDIALSVSVNLMSKGGNMIGLKVSQEILNVWQKEKEEVFADALENSAKIFPARCYDIFRALMTGASYEGEDFMNENCEEVLSNGFPEKCISTLDFDHGSAVIFYPGVAERLCEYLHTENLYLTFTSINEVLVTPAKENISVEKLKERLGKELENNRNPGDRLTNVSEVILCL